MAPARTWTAALALSLTLGAGACAQAPKPGSQVPTSTTPASPASPAPEKLYVPNGPEAAEALRQIQSGSGNVAQYPPSTLSGAALKSVAAPRPGAGAAPAAKPPVPAANVPGADAVGNAPRRPMLVPVGPGGIGEPSEIPGLQNGLSSGPVPEANAPAGPGMEDFHPSGLPDGGAFTEGGAPLNAPPSAALPPFFATEAPTAPEPPTPVPIAELSILYSVVILLAVGYFWYTARTAPREERG